MFIPIVSNENSKDKQIWCVKFCLAGFHVDRKEVFILLLRHRAGIGVNSKSTCQAGATQLSILSGPPLR